MFLCKELIFCIILMIGHIVLTFDEKTGMPYQSFLAE